MAWELTPLRGRLRQHTRVWYGLRVENATQDLVPGVTDFLPGCVVAGKYRVERLIARGGMGAVFAAHHLILDQTVAIKVLLPEHAGRPGAAARFMNEARAVARMKSEHIAAVMDVGQLENDGAYMVLEYLEGVDLDDLVSQRGPQPIDQSTHYVLQALEAIAQAHSLGIIHRDLKPANIYLARQPDGSEIIKVLDFGISKIVVGEGEANENLTSTHSIIGSPASISPEQLRNSKRVDVRTDIWAMGVILYHLLTGKLPFVGETFGELFSAILEHTPARTTELRSEVPKALDDIVFRCLERDREARFANAAELAVALAPFAPPGANVSIERICRALGRDPNAPVPSVRRVGQKPPGSVTHEAVSVDRAIAVTGDDVQSPTRPSRVRSLWLPTAVGVALGTLCVGVVVSRVRPALRAQVVAPVSLAPSSVPPPESASASPSTPPLAPATASPAVEPLAESAASEPAPSAPPVASTPPPAPHPTSHARQPKPPKPASPSVDDTILLQRN